MKSLIFNCSIFALMVIAPLSATASQFEFTETTYSAIESDQSVSVYIARDDSTTFAAIDVLVKNGTAISGQDYGAVTRADTTNEPGIYRVEFASGQTQARIDIEILGDDAVDNKFFSLALRPVQYTNRFSPGDRLGAKRAAVVRINEIPGGVTAPVPLQLNISLVDAPSFGGDRNKVVVKGTPGDDTFVFDPNGWSTIVDPDFPEDAQLCYCLCDQTVEFDGLGGNDRLALMDNNPDSVVTATVMPNSFRYVTTVTAYEWYSTSTADFPFLPETFVYRFSGRNIESIDLNTCLGGSFGDAGDSRNGPFNVDKVFLLDSAGDDNLVIGPKQSVMTGTGYINRVSGFDSVVAYSLSGFDQSFFEDSPEDDVFTGKQDFARITGERDNPKLPDEFPLRYTPFGMSTKGVERYQQLRLPFDCYAAGFAKTYATATTGFDVAHLYDSPDDDHYFGNAVYGLLEGPDLFLRATRFDSVGVYSSLGKDSALLGGSARDDYFVAKGASTTALFDVDRRFAHTLKSFSATAAIGNGGSDEAQFYDGATRTSVFAQPTGVEMYADGVFSRAVGFERVLAISTHDAENILFQLPGLPYFLGRIGNW